MHKRIHLINFQTLINREKQLLFLDFKNFNTSSSYLMNFYRKNL